jgi:hypothetical protein
MRLDIEALPEFSSSNLSAMLVTLVRTLVMAVQPVRLYSTNLGTHANPY